MSVVIQIVIFRLWRRVVWFVHKCLGQKFCYRLQSRSEDNHNAMKLYRVAHTRLSHFNSRVQKVSVGSAPPCIYLYSSQKGGHSDPPSSLRTCRRRQHISTRRRYHRTALHGVTKPQKCKTNNSSFCCSLSRVYERTAATCLPVTGRRGSGTGGLPAHGE
jgi:hypothetical protein